MIADEAHRSQYDFIDGYARHMRDALPNASFIGFTGTPIELADASTRAVFGDHISVYDIQRAVEDGATVPIYYESRLAKLALDETEKPTIDAGFEEVTEGEEVDRREKLKTKWAQLEAIVGAGKAGRAHRPRHRRALRAPPGGDGRQGDGGLHEPPDLHRPLPRAGPPAPGMARRRREPRRAESRDDRQGVRPARLAAAHRQQGPSRGAGQTVPRPGRSLRMVLVRDMWLTGFDAPSLHTMYVDKPMRGHGLMQAIARVNRVFRDKPGGLVVDYLGLAHELKRALATYTESGGTGETALDKEQAVRAMLEKYEVCCGLFHGFDWSAWQTARRLSGSNCCPRRWSTSSRRITARPAACGRPGAVAGVRPGRAASRNHAHPRRRVVLFQHGRAALSKRMRLPKAKSPTRSWITRCGRSSRGPWPQRACMDIFAAAGLEKPDVSILSEEFLDEVRGMRRTKSRHRACCRSC